jgi:hypothetical protein
MVVMFYGPGLKYFQESKSWAIRFIFLEDGRKHNGWQAQISHANGWLLPTEDLNRDLSSDLPSAALAHQIDPYIWAHIYCFPKLSHHSGTYLPFQCLG